MLSLLSVPPEPKFLTVRPLRHKQELYLWIQEQKHKHTHLHVFSRFFNPIWLPSSPSRELLVTCGHYFLCDVFFLPGISCKNTFSLLWLTNIFQGDTLIWSQIFFLSTYQSCFFALSRATSRTLVPRQGIKPIMPLVVEVQSTSYWTRREVPTDISCFHYDENCRKVTFLLPSSF